MPRLRRLRPEGFIILYILCLAVFTAWLVWTHGPYQLLMVMFVPILLSVILYPRRLYVITLPLLISAFVIVQIYEKELDLTVIGLVTGSLVTIVVAEAIYHLLTERVRLNALLYEREAISRAIIEQSPLGNSVRSRTGKLLHYNNAWRKIWALPQEKIQEDMARERKQLVLDRNDLYLGEAASDVEQVYRQGGQAYLPELKADGMYPGSAEWVSQYFYAIQDATGQVGQVVILTEDITKRKRVEQAEYENRILAEALVDTAAALNSTLKLEEVLERILINVRRVVPHDAVNIMLLKDGTASVIRCRGYTERGLEELMNNLRLNLADTPYLRHMAEIGAPVFVPDTLTDAGWRNMPETMWIRSYAGAPIRIRGEPVGFLNLDSAQAGFFTALHAERLRAFADQAATAIDNARLYEEVKRLAIMDELTGVYNFRGLFELGQRELERTRRYNYPLSALFFDIDHFRLFNKQFTHSVGNQVLKAVAECSKVRVRAVDIVARYGGEEFAILLSQTEAAKAIQVADRLRQDIEAMYITTEYGNLSVTVSIGVAELTPDVGDLAMLLDRADQAEHEAKESGRNIVKQWMKL